MLFKKWSLFILLALVGSMLLTACGQTEVEVTRVVKETVVETVKETVVETVKETVIVAGTPEVKEVEVTKIVEVEKVVTATPPPAPEGPTGELRVAAPHNFVALDLIGPLCGERTNLSVHKHLFDMMVRRDDETGQIVPGLAESWDAPDESTWIFNIRPGVKFHDGTDATAEDAKATLEAFIEKKCPLSPVLRGIAEIQAPDPLTLVIKTERPLGALLGNLSLLGIAPSERVNDEDFMQNPVGSGPFRFVSLAADTELVLTANEDYWAGAPGVERLIYRFIPEATGRLTALETGEIDITWSIAADQVSRLEKDPDLVVEKVPAFIGTETLVNWERPPLDDVRVRQALVYAIDTEAIADTILGGLANPIESPIPSTVFGAAQLEPYGYNPEKARELLAEAGYEDGINITALLRPVQREQDLAQAMISDWAKVGINVEPLPEEQAQWVEDYVNENFDLAVTFRPHHTGDADYTLGRLYMSASNRVPCASPTLDDFILHGGSATDPKEREAAYAEALGYMWDEVCGIYTHELLDAHAWRTRVQGFVPSPSTVPSFYSVTVTD